MKKFLALILSACMILGLCSCGSGDSKSDKDYVQGKKTLIVGITDFAPMDYLDDNGNWIGFDADMAKAFAESLGCEAQFVEIDWDNKVNEINNKSIDCVWNGMTLNAGVTTAMDCGKAYCDNAQVVVVNAAVAANYQTKDSLKDLNFAVEAGSAGKDAVAEENLKFIEVSTQADALMEVAAGTSDACVIDLLMAGAMIGEGTSYPNLAYTVSLTSEQYGVGFRKGSDLPAAYNAFYDKAYADGTVLEIAKKYGVQESIID